MVKKYLIILTATIFTLSYIWNDVAIALEIDKSKNDIIILGCEAGSLGADLSSVSPGKGEPNGITFPKLDPKKMADAIEAYIEETRPNSPLKGTSAKAVVSASKADVNPFFAYVQALLESELATTSVSGAQIKIHQGHNAFGRTALESQPHVVEGGRLWYKWSSFEASFDVNAPENDPPESRGDWYAYVRAVYSDEIDKGLSAYINKYAPPSDGNDTSGYIEKVQSQVDRMAELAGATITTSSSSGTSSSRSGSGACCSTSSTGTQTGVVPLEDDEQTILGYLMSVGDDPKLTLAQAAGIAGNLFKESTYNPKASNGTHHGIAQWDNNDRWNNGVVAFAKDMNGDPYDLNIQLRYLAFEMGLTNEWQGHTAKRGGVATALRATSTPSEAATLFNEKFEGSGDNSGKREEKAEEIYNKYKDNPPLANPSQSAGPCSSGASGNVQALQEYTLKYAWPERRGTVQKKPEYEEAVTKAKSEGRYTGGIAYPGVDCGGFVTLLVYDSGWDKTYNNEGKGGYSSDGTGTSYQESWAKDNWISLGTNGQTYLPDGSTFSEDKLQPGDVAFSPGHTWIYVGQIDGFGSKYAAASLDDHSPEASSEGFSYNGARWYRKK